MSAEQPDLLEMLEALVEAGKEMGPIERVLPLRVDDHRTHIVFKTDDDRPGQWSYFALVDLGSVLRAWTGQGVDFDPESAIAFGRAMVEWGEARS